MSGVDDGEVIGPGDLVVLDGVVHLPCRRDVVTTVFDRNALVGVAVQHQLGHTERKPVQGRGGRVQPWCGVGSEKGREGPSPSSSSAQRRRSVMGASATTEVTRDSVAVMSAR